MKTILAQDLKICDKIVRSPRLTVVAKDVFKSPINGRVYVTFEELHETGRFMIETDFHFDSYMTRVTVQ
jgi:hypothetical protein